jgi:AcrR family transcriptional regulator
MARGHRDALLQAARRLLRDKGLVRTTTRDLVQASQTNLASIGYHFGGKNALMAEAMGLIFQEWTDRPVAAALPGSGDPATPGTMARRTAAALREMLADLPERRADVLAFAEAVAEAGRDEDLRLRLSEMAERSLAAVAASVADVTPGLPPEASRAVASVIVGLHDGLAINASLDPANAPDADTVLLALAGLGTVLAAGYGLPVGASAADLAAFAEAAAPQPADP